MLNRKNLLAAALTSASLAALSMPTTASAQDAVPNATPECQEAIFDAGAGAAAGTTVPGALQCGVNAKASGTNSVAVGTNANADGNGSTAIGQSAVADGSNSTAIGTLTRVLSADSLAAGIDVMAIGEP